MPRGLGEQLAKVRGEHPVSLDLGGTPRGLGHVPRAGLGILLGEAPGKEASRPDGVLASGGSPAAVHVELSREPSLQDRLALGVGNFPNPLPWNSEL